MSEKTLILYEHASGYSLFRLEKEIGSVSDLSLFKSVVSLVAFHPFTNAQTTLDSALEIIEGNIPENLTLFLEENLPSKKKKRASMILGVADPKLGSAISEAFEIKCSSSGMIPEIIRGIRFHYHDFMEGDKDTLLCAESSLGRSCSRFKVKYNIKREDNMIIQSVWLLDKLDKNINSFSMRLREWYSFHFPELFKIVNDNLIFAKLASLIGDRNLIEDYDQLAIDIQKIVNDENKTSSIIHALKTSMGMEITEIDIDNIKKFSDKVINLTAYKQDLQDYLNSRMQNAAPSLSTLIGETIGARLISRAGSLINLAKYPASTLQILGAEKALFRALKSRTNTPKFGLIYHSSYIGKASGKNKGKVSRCLANACSLATRVDCFSEEPSNEFGKEMKKKLEDRIAKFNN